MKQQDRHFRSSDVAPSSALLKFSWQLFRSSFNSKPQDVSVRSSWLYIFPIFSWILFSISLFVLLLSLHKSEWWSSNWYLWSIPLYSHVFFLCLYTMETAAQEDIAPFISRWPHCMVTSLKCRGARFTRQKTLCCWDQNDHTTPYIIKGSTHPPCSLFLFIPYTHVWALETTGNVRQ